MPTSTPFDEGARRLRSPAFPFISLGKAIVRARSIAERYGRHPVSLAAAIRTLAMDEARRIQLSRRGREIQRERYTMQRMLDAYLSEYDRLLEKAGSRAPRRRLAVGHVP